MKKLFVGLILTFLFFKIHSQVINVEDKRIRLGDSVAIKGHIDLGFNVFKNDKQLVTAAGSGLLEAVNRKHFWLIVGGYNLVKSSGSNFLNDGYLHMRYNYDLSKKVVFEAFTQAQYNERTRSLFRGLIGTGLRFKIRIFEKQRIYMGLSYMFEHNQFNDATQRQYDSRLSTYISFNISLSDKIKFVNTTYYQPLLSDFMRHRISSQGSLVFSITKRLAYRSTGSLTFDNDYRLPSVVPDLIYTWTNGIRWEFGK